jgi:hypothetical protein
MYAVDFIRWIHSVLFFYGPRLPPSQNTKTQFLKDEVGGKVGAGLATLVPACTVQNVKLPHEENFNFGKILNCLQYYFILMLFLLF